jgi:hypothetical protein
MFAVILYYDYFLTLPMEIERFWPQRTFSWALFLFYLNRYLALLGEIPIIILYFLPKAPQVSIMPLSVVESLLTEIRLVYTYKNITCTLR